MLSAVRWITQTQCVRENQVSYCGHIFVTRVPSAGWRLNLKPSEWITPLAWGIISFLKGIKPEIEGRNKRNTWLWDSYKYFSCPITNFNQNLNLTHHLDKRTLDISTAGLTAWIIHKLKPYLCMKAAITIQANNKGSPEINPVSFSLFLIRRWRANEPHRSHILL